MPTHPHPGTSRVARLQEQRRRSRLVSLALAGLIALAVLLAGVTTAQAGERHGRDERSRSWSGKDHGNSHKGYDKGRKDKGRDKHDRGKSWDKGKSKDRDHGSKSDHGKSWKKKDKGKDHGKYDAPKPSKPRWHPKPKPKPPVKCKPKPKPKPCKCAPKPKPEKPKPHPKPKPKPEKPKPEVPTPPVVPPAPPAPPVVPPAPPVEQPPPVDTPKDVPTFHGTATHKKRTPKKETPTKKTPPQTPGLLPFTGPEAGDLQAHPDRMRNLAVFSLALLALGALFLAASNRRKAQLVGADVGVAVRAAARAMAGKSRDARDPTISAERVARGAEVAEWLRK